MVNLFIVYESDIWSRDLKTDFKLGSSLFGTVIKYGYSDYGIEFDARSLFSLSNNKFSKNCYYFSCRKYFIGACW